MQKEPKNQRSSSGWKRTVLILACFGLIIVRWIWPTFQVDSTTIWLLVIAAILFVLPDLKSLTPYIKRIKIGETEVELKEEIEKLDTEIKKASIAAETEENRVFSKDKVELTSKDIDKVIEEAGKDPRAALLLISSKLERRVRDRLEEANIEVKRQSAVKLVETGVEQGIFPYEFNSAFRDFWAVRNKVAHGEAFDVNDDYILSLISLGTELYKAST